MYSVKKISIVLLCAVLSAFLVSCSLFPEPTTENPTTHSPTTQEEKTPVTEKILTGTVINAPGQVNIRSEPNSSCEILGTANNGEIFVVLKAFFSPSWHQIAYKGQTAYIYKDYFQINNETENTSSEGSVQTLPETGTAKPTTSAKPTTISPTTTKAPTATVSQTTSIKPTTTPTTTPATTAGPTESQTSPTTVESSTYGYVVRNREQLLEMVKILMFQLEPEIKFDIRYCSDNSYKYMNGIISEASAEIELEKGIADIEDKWSWEYNSTQMTVSCEYEYSKTQLDQTIGKAKSVAETIIKNNPGASDYEIELAIHDYIVNNTVYDERYSSGSEPTESHTAYGTLVLGKSVCEGYAEAMNLLCHFTGIECICVDGQGKGELHAWNIVYVDEAYYQVDVTWDDPVLNDGTQTLKHYYFNISDEKMALDHSWAASDYPKCSSMTCNYYYMNSLVVKTIDEFKSKLQNAVANRQSGIELMIEGYTTASKQALLDTIYNTIYAQGSNATRYWYLIKDTLGIVTVYGIEYKK